MSRIGNRIMTIPAKAKAELKDNVLNVSGPLGNFSYKIPAGLTVEIKDGRVTVKIVNEADRDTLNAIHGTTAANIANLLNGVTTGFSKFLEINGLGYKAAVAGTKLTVEAGFSHPVVLEIPKGLSIVLDPKTNLLEVKGADKFLVGDFAAKIRRIRPPEPYKGSGIKYQGEYRARKAGKTAATGGAGGAK